MDCFHRRNNYIRQLVIIDQQQFIKSLSNINTTDLCLTTMFSARSILFSVLVIVFMAWNANAVSMSDGLTSGTILASHGGELNPAFIGGGSYGQYNNYAGYSPYYGSGFFGR